MTIVVNPLLALLPELRPAAPSLTSPEASQRDHDALEASVAALDALLALGEYHEVTVPAGGATYPHTLGRKPNWRVIVWQSGSSTIYDDRGTWTTTTFNLNAAADTNAGVFLL